MILDVASLAKLGRKAEMERALDRLYNVRPEIKISDIVWMYRRVQRPESLTAQFVEAFQEAGIPEGNYRPLDVAASEAVD